MEYFGVLFAPVRTQYIINVTSLMAKLAPICSLLNLNNDSSFSVLKSCKNNNSEPFN